MTTPAHKVVGDVGKPGQIVPSPSAPGTDLTLSDYLARKRRYAALDTVALEKINAVKKLTFDEWFTVYRNKFHWSIDKNDCFEAWKAAQENV
jgi:hypothetical protein